MVSGTRAGLAVAIAALAGPLLAAAPAGAAGPARAGTVQTLGRADIAASQPTPDPGVFVEVSPGTVEPGFLVGIRASCRDNSMSAIVVSDAFGRVAVQPQGGVLTAAPMVRERTLPGSYRVKLECRDGQTASTMLQVVRAMPTSSPPPPSRGPATGFGGGAGGFTGGLLLPGGLALIVTGAVVWLLAARRHRTVRGAARR